MPATGEIGFVGARRPESRSVAVLGHAPVALDHPVALAVGRGGHAGDGVGRRLAAHRPVEAGVPEGEDPAVPGRPSSSPCRRGWQPCPVTPAARCVAPSTRRTWRPRRRRSRRRRRRASSPCHRGWSPCPRPAGRDGPPPSTRRSRRRRRRRRPRRARPASSPCRRGSAAMATMGPSSLTAPSDPSKGASPKANTPPSAATSQ